MARKAGGLIVFIVDASGREGGREGGRERERRGGGENSRNG